MAATKAFDLFARIGVDNAAFAKALKKSETMAGTFATKLSARFSKMATRTAQGMAASVGASIIASAHMATQFEKNMASVNTMIGGNAERLAELSESVKSISKETGKGLGIMAEGLYEVESAYGDSAEAAAMLELNTKAAVAGQTTVKDAISLTSAVTKGYGDQSLLAQTKAADLAFQTVVLGQTTFPELASAIQAVTSDSGKMGVTQEEMFAAMATGANVIGTTSEVATKFRAALVALDNPSEGLNTALKDMGYESGKTMIAQLGLQGTFKTLADYAERTNTPMGKLIGSTEGQAAAFLLTNSQAEKYTENLAAMEGASGAMVNAYEIQQDTVSALQARLKSHFEVILVNLGEKFLPVMESILKWTIAHMPEIQAGITTAFDGIGAAFTGFKTWLNDNMPTIKATINVILTTINTVKDGVVLAWTGIRTAFSTAQTFIKGIIALFITDTESASTGANTMLTNIVTVLTSLGAAFKVGFEFIKTLFDTVVIPIFKNFAASVKLYFEATVWAWDSVLKPALTAMSPYFTSIFNAILAIVNGVIESITLTMKGLTDFLKGDFESGFTNLFAALTVIFDGFGVALKTVFDGYVTTMTSILKAAVTSLKTIGGDLMQGLLDGIAGMATSVKTSVTNTANNIVDWFKNPFDTHSPSRVFFGIAVDVLQGWINGWKSKISEVLNLVKSTADKIVNVFNPKLTAPNITLPGSPGYTGSTSAPSTGSSEPSALVGFREEIKQNTEAMSISRARLYSWINTISEAGNVQRQGTEGMAAYNVAVAHQNEYLTSTIGMIGTRLTQAANWMFETVTSVASTFGSAILDLAVSKVPMLGTALQAAAQGPIAAVAAVFAELLGESEAFKGFVKAATNIFKHLVGMIDKFLGPTLEKVTDVLITLFAAIEPLIEMLLILMDTALAPVIWVLQNVVAPVFAAVADFVAAIWNGLATVINAVLGWLGVHLPMIDRNKAKYTGKETTGRPAPTTKPEPELGPPKWQPTTPEPYQPPAPPAGGGYGGGSYSGGYSGQATMSQTSTTGNQFTNLSGTAIELFTNLLSPLASLDQLVGIGQSTNDILQNMSLGGTTTLSIDNVYMNGNIAPAEAATQLADAVEELLTERVNIRNEYGA